MNGVLKLKPLLVSLFATLGLGFLRSILSGDVQAKYLSLNLPDFAPPPVVFPIVWTILYVLIAVAVYLVYTSTAISKRERDRYLSAYSIMLVLNASWSVIFFGLGRLKLGFWVIAAILIASITTAILFFRANKVATILMIPYILWLIFALVLNYAIVQMN